MTLTIGIHVGPILMRPVHHVLSQIVMLDVLQVVLMVIIVIAFAVQTARTTLGLGIIIVAPTISLPVKVQAKHPSQRKHHQMQ
jgi:hypothetical protein